MRQRLRSAAAILSVSLLLMGFSCHHRALQTSLGVAASLKAMQDGEIGLHNAGKVSNDEHKLLQQKFIVLAQTDKDVRACIYTSGVPACVDIGINAVNTMLADPAVVGIKNEDSKKQIQVLGQSLLLALNTLKGAL